MSFCALPIVLTANGFWIAPARWLVRLVWLAAAVLTSTASYAGSSSLTWAPPSTNTDGSALTNLAGYRIFWGCSSLGTYPNSVTLNDPGATGYVVEGLPDVGTCYFVVTAVNSRGVESSYSNAAAKNMGTLSAPGKPGLSVTWSESGPLMAITQTGSVEKKFDPSGANTGSTSVTVPADAEVMIVAVGGFHGTAGHFSPVGALSCGGKSSTVVAAADGSTSTWQGALHLILLPATGSQTLAWDWNGASNADDPEVMISWAWFKGLDTTTPTRDADAAQGGGTSRTSATLTAQTGDLIVAVSTAFTDGSEGAWTWTDATKLADLAFYTYSDGSWATASPTGDQTVTAAITTGAGGEPTVMAFVLQPAAVGGGISIPVVQHFRQRVF